MTTRSEIVLPDGTPVEVGPAGSPLDSLLERLAERVGGRAGVQIVYGEPVTRGEVTVIPVARVRWGFGGGGGTGTNKNPETGEPQTGQGSGGGGGVDARPAGFIEIADGKATFQPITASGPAALLPLIPVLIAVTWAALRILRAVRKR